MNMADSKQQLSDKFNEFISSGSHDTHLGANWEMRNGIYQQYSAYKDSTPSESDTINCLSNYNHVL